MLLLHKTMTEKQIKLKIYSLMRPFIRGLPAHYNNIEQEYDYLFGANRTSKYKLTILNTCPRRQGMMFNYPD